ncbi:L,D-transpeptidase family protein [Enterococcus casseliflavus]|uniref:L,D-transpeptidase family protein n=1 Tax=Enterococcus casseliflavus TaxID=37734 RepID=UPI00288E398F|nr:L,D-transpeptidase family protein [Enterococcus casseliflavus]MDT2986757.1 L,D-transpeptidase family protein [Enterococcus casseliflavus]
MTRSNKHTDAKNNTKKIVLIVVAALLVVIAGGYTYRSTYYANRFLPKTEIDGIDISNKTVAEANALLHDRYSQEAFTIKDGDSEWKTVNLAQFGLQTDFTDELQSLKDEQNQWSWGMAYVSAAEEKTLDNLSVDQDTLSSETNTIQKELETLNEDRTKSADATLEKGEDGFSIKPEVDGDAIDVDKAVADLQEAIVSGEKELNLVDYVTKPSVTADDPDLTKEMDSLNKIAKVTGNYTINGNTFQIPRETIMDWLSYKDGNTTIDEDKVRSYVTSIGEQYNTSTNSSTLQSTKQGEVTVPAGTLSWTIQTDAETEALIEALKAGEDFTRTPIAQGSTDAGSPLFGNTYIEVDLKNQHMWYYKDGELVLDTKIISGKPATPTPTGVFYVWNKEEDATLTGEDYASPVDYWMPIDWTGVGIHDSDWQTEYGGDLWKTRGSHGCINTPPGVMKELYSKAEVGTPVIVI